MSLKLPYSDKFLLLSLYYFGKNLSKYEELFLDLFYLVDCPEIVWPTTYKNVLSTFSICSKILSGKADICQCQCQVTVAGLNYFCSSLNYVKGRPKKVKVVRSPRVSRFHGYDAKHSSKGLIIYPIIMKTFFTLPFNGLYERLILIIGNNNR